MPSPNQTLRNNSNSPSFVSGITSSSSEHHTHSKRKSLSFPQLFAIYNEIVNEWCKEQWLTFIDHHTETYLTLDLKTNEILTVQTAIDRYYLTTGELFLHSQPECLLIRTESKTETLVIPNSIISLENIYNNDGIHRILRYKLMAIISHSNKTNSKVMFYKDSHLNSWFIYYDQSILSHSHSSILSEEDQNQLQSYIEQKNSLNPLKFTSPLSTLCNHPIIYVYMPEKN
jgi:hypothetical protein